MGEIIAGRFGQEREVRNVLTDEAEYDLIFDAALDMVRNSEPDNDGTTFTRSVGALLFEVSGMIQAGTCSQSLRSRSHDVAVGWSDFVDGISEE